MFVRSIPIDWDPALEARGVKVNHVVRPGGRPVYIVRSGRFDTSGEKNHIFVKVLDEQGQRAQGVSVEFYWGDGQHRVPYGEKEWADMVLSAGGNSYGVRLFSADGTPSDEVWGMGLGRTAYPVDGTHVAYYLVFGRVLSDAPVLPPPPPPAPSPYLGSLRERLTQAIALLQGILAEIP